MKLIWFNDQPDSIRVMGDKSTARDTMKKAGVPTVPGSEGLLQVLYFYLGSRKSFRCF